ncbi:cytochrome P450 [Actinocrispum wychmicini]|uniref:Cytochrome P450 n=1 Tax=Actinocrispum wychmicini TaxID=1213861 RepID=A0A4R2JIM6_9PSEU|nr:cytochrome P450 [Actinocrispum wychmicini]TCO56838.1 hypothetical protein EV192_106313 [Actinocrispum wychmicini]
MYFSEALGAWIATRYADVDRVLTDHVTFSSDELRYSAQEIPHRDNPVLSSLVATDPPRHHELRRIVSQVFTPRAVANVDIETTVRGLLDRVGDEADVVDGIAYPMSVTTIAGLLGVPADPDFIRWTEAITSFAGVFTEDDTRKAEFHRARAEMTDYFRAELARPRGSDIIGTLARSGLGGDELVDFCSLLLINGHETTKTLLVNAVMSLYGGDRRTAGRSGPPAGRDRRGPPVPPAGRRHRPVHHRVNHVRRA